MAIIACKECAREVSDKAVSCPHCGVPIAGAPIAEAPPRKPRRVKSWLYGILIIGLLAWGALTSLWLTGILPVPKHVVEWVGISSKPVRTVKASEKTAEQVQVIATAPTAFQPKSADSAVYRTSVEQLYLDYDANEVAIQSKIGNNPIRVTGSVGGINEDTSGYPVVTLRTGGDDRADMILTDDQRSAAAQLSKEDAVEIQCGKMQRVASRLHGSGCALLLVDAGAKLVYLAVSLSSKAGDAPLYIVGPMSRKTCLASSDTIAMQVTSNPRSDRILSKSCAATARESVSLDGCHLSSSMSAIPDIPTAHLWKYDCVTPAAESRKAVETAPSRGTHVRRAAALDTTAAIAVLSQPTPEPAAADSDATATKASQEAVPIAVAAAANLPERVPIGTPAAGPPAPALENNPRSANVAAPATVDTSPASGPRPLAPVAESSSTPSASAPSPAVADDLVPVRTKDPEAANRIASYCSKMTSGATNPATVATRCRRDEMDAWTRLIVQNEFPNLDETSRRKCTEPPFPDSFVARESCAKYQLHLD
jgi:putative nucleic acid binding protein